MGGAIELLVEYPDQRKILLDSPDFIRPSVDEFLRMTSPVQNLARTTTRDVQIHETVIPEGQKVMLVYGAANRDEREFGDTSEVLDVRRQFKKMLSLGYGPHHCLGAAVARTIAWVTLECILSRFPNFTVNAAEGRFAPGSFVRRYEYLPFMATP